MTSPAICLNVVDEVATREEGASADRRSGKRTSA